MILKGVKITYFLKIQLILFHFGGCVSNDTHTGSLSFPMFVFITGQRCV